MGAEKREEGKGTLPNLANFCTKKGISAAVDARQEKKEVLKNVNSVLVRP